jgi:hypothetical protein
MTLLKAAGKAALTLASSTRPAREGAERPASGWDPYEVWRTRVLLPRLEEKQLAVAKEQPPDPLLARSA